ncbi:hypothetical protein F2P44_16525 [Massilia sp. CCM 8695]|uniref:Carbohydrate kinase PfkB domain-containing protein n=1 Tax=Massilia frigida TaxID=2609281 RepID=A0ABX0N663_9BURK|nr:hypothetical protein [Massilia frigida]
MADRDITPRQACAALPPGTRLLHTGGLALVPDDLAKALTLIQAARDAGALMSIDANVRPLACADLARYAAGVQAALRHADLIKVSEEDLLHLGCGGPDPLAQASALFDTLPVRLIALTLGAQGALLLTRTASVRIATPSGLAVIDIVGCGDCFLAGLVASLAGQDLLSAAALDRATAPALEQAGRYAVAVASLNAMREGCDPPSRAEVEAFLRQVGRAA